jgi:hypothetical protein
MKPDKPKPQEPLWGRVLSAPETAEAHATNAAFVDWIIAVTLQDEREEREKRRPAVRDKQQHENNDDEAQRDAA